MEKNILKLDNGQPKGTAYTLRERVEEELSKKSAEIQCTPTFILPKAADVKGRALVLDLESTNYRVAVVDSTQEKLIIYPNNGWKKDMSVIKSSGYTHEELLKELADLIVEIKREKEVPIGYCFSYPAESMPGRDAKLLRRTRGADIRKMVGRFVGKPLSDYLNEKNKIKFAGIKILNDTIVSLFVGFTDRSYDVYIGLIVGIGTNMVTFIPASKIRKLDPAYSVEGLIPVNLGSGNLHPPFLTAVDDAVDIMSDSAGKQRFEKVVPGMYSGDMLRATPPLDEFEEKFNVRRLTIITNYPDIHEDIYVRAACWICSRSAQLAATSLAEPIVLLKSYNKDIHRVCLTAEGSLFWNESREDKSYSILAMEKLQEPLHEL